MNARTVPVFTVHRGCPHRCVFCDQKSITESDFDPARVPDYLEQSFAVPANRGAQIAFFGGSFTAMEREDMLFLLRAAQGFVDRGLASGIRLSTRPDALGESVQSDLRRFSVKAVELGVQSMSDRVLTLSGRGHSSADTLAAAEAVKKNGWELTGQMMLGLPGSTPDDEEATAKSIVAMGAECARVYPTAVYKNTALERMIRSASYVPLSHADAIERAKRVLEIFFAAGVKLLRVGLCANESLASQTVAGETSPDFGEEVLSAMWRDRLDAALSSLPDPAGKSVKVFCSRRELSRAAGHRALNRAFLKEKYALRSLSFFAGEGHGPFEARIETD